MKKIIVALLLIAFVVSGCSSRPGVQVDTEGFTAKHIEITEMVVQWNESIMNVRIKNISDEELAIVMAPYVYKSNGEEAFISCRGIGTNEPVTLASGEESDWLMYYGFPEDAWKTIIFYDYGHMEGDVATREDFFVAIEKDSDKTVSIADKKKVRKMWDELSLDE